MPPARKRRARVPVLVVCACLAVALIYGAAAREGTSNIVHGSGLASAHSGVGSVAPREEGRLRPGGFGVPNATKPSFGVVPAYRNVGKGGGEDAEGDKTFGIKAVGIFHVFRKPPW